MRMPMMWAHPERIIRKTMETRRRRSIIRYSSTVCTSVKWRQGNSTTLCLWITSICSHAFQRYADASSSDLCSCLFHLAICVRPLRRICLVDLRFIVDWSILPASATLIASCSSSLWSSPSERQFWISIWIERFSTSLLTRNINSSTNCRYASMEFSHHLGSIHFLDLFEPGLCFSWALVFCEYHLRRAAECS